MSIIEVLFWCCAAIVFYTYIGYGIVLYIMVRIKESICKPTQLSLNEPLLQVTLLIAAYNEQSVVEMKMDNTLQLDYPADRLNIVWVTDGSTDATVEMLGKYDRIEVIHDPVRGGKAAAFNHAMQSISTPLVIFTDANTMLNREAIMEIVRLFSDPKVGCVAGEKRVGAESPITTTPTTMQNTTKHSTAIQSAIEQPDAAATEGIYWKYESVLKSLDYRLYTAVGAAGELFAIRTPLYEVLPSNTLLDDFMLSMRIAQRGYKIAYCDKAYATEGTSANMHEEGKRKIRIAAGGLQSIYRLRALLNIIRYGMLSFQYISHRVLRWSVTPVALFAMVPLNISLVAAATPSPLYTTLLVLQAIFYGAGIAGWYLSACGKKSRLLFVPYYFLFMNINVLRGANYLRTHRGSGVWEKAKRG